METRFSGRDISLEPLGEEDDEETYSPIAYLTDGSEPTQMLEAEQTRRLRGEGLERALSSLDARSRRIIEARWLRETDTATLHDLADELGVSAERAALPLGEQPVHQSGADIADVQLTRG